MPTESLPPPVVSDNGLMHHWVMQYSGTVQYLVNESVLLPTQQEEERRVAQEKRTAAEMRRREELERREREVECSCLSLSHHIHSAHLLWV